MHPRRDGVGRRLGNLVARDAGPFTVWRRCLLPLVALVCRPQRAEGVGKRGDSVVSELTVGVRLLLAPVPVVQCRLPRVVAALSREPTISQDERPELVGA